MSFSTPGQPDSQLIDILHRRGGQYVGLYTINAGQFIQLGGIKASETGELFPEFRRHMLRDAYFTNNGLKEPSKNSRMDTSPLTGLQIVSRKSEDYAVITSAYVDLDPDLVGMTQGQVLGELWDMQKDGRIPVPSVLTDSGRGFWAYWIIRQPLSEMPVEADQVARNQHRAIEEDLIRRLRRIGADHKAKDIPRISRVPGSVNTKSEGSRRVGFVVLADNNGCVPTYTLSEMCAWLDVEAAASTVSIGRKRHQRRTDAERTEAHVRQASGWRRRFEVVVESIKVLIRIRGGRIGVGHRNHMLLYLGWALKCLNGSESSYGMHTFRELCGELSRVNEKHCEHPNGDEITQSQVKSIARHAWHMKYPVQHNTIADALEITLDESQKIAAEIKGGKGLPAAAQWRPKGAPMTAAQKREARRDLIKRMMTDRGGEAPTLAEFVDECRVRLKFAPSRTTISADLKMLGIETGREWADAPDEDLLV